MMICDGRSEPVIDESGNACDIISGCRYLETSHLSSSGGNDLNARGCQSLKPHREIDTHLARLNDNWFMIWIDSRLLFALFLFISKSSIAVELKVGIFLVLPGIPSGLGRTAGRSILWH